MAIGMPSVRRRPREIQFYREMYQPIVSLGSYRDRAATQRRLRDGSWWGGEEGGAQKIVQILTKDVQRVGTHSDIGTACGNSLVEDGSTSAANTSVPLYVDTLRSQSCLLSAAASPQPVDSMVPRGTHYKWARSVCTRAAPRPRASDYIRSSTHAGASCAAPFPSPGGLSS